ncbi:MAG: UbiA family prenyltransferase, partial [Gammaproteobacteria bacterium]|nr:UbiA family prenyltransferase [Gammaproteobacteria bacterium]
EGRPDAVNFFVFVAGVIVMRSAGCVINDYADRHIDGAVARTRSRPLAAGLVAPMEAMALFAVLGLVALALLILLNPLARLLAIGAAALTVVYPFSKRWLAAPQFLLGAAFGWGIPMAFAAETGVVPRLAWLLWLDVVVWAVIYDTMYAMADRDEDLRIGVKSTAILFGSADLFIIFLLQVVLVVGLVLAGREAELGLWYQAGVAAGAALLANQLWMIRHRDPGSCLEAFRANRHFGAAIFAGILLDYTFRAAA